MSNNPKIIEAIDRATVATLADGSPRSHLGLSEIGESCDRMLWLKFRWSLPELFEGQRERIFNHGKFAEIRMAAILKNIKGVTLYDKNPETGEQYQVSYLGGHLGGSTDGLISGLPGTDGWGIWEHKTANNISFNAMVKHGIQKAGELHRKGMEPEVSLYYTQANCYCFAFGQRQALWTIEGKNKGELDVQTMNVDEDAAKRAIDRGARIIMENHAPVPKYKPTFYRVRFMSKINQAIYNGERLPAPNCRNCRHSSPNVEDGTWRCARFDSAVLDLERQRAGCADHTYITSLVSAVVDHEDSDSVAYRRPGDGYEFVNTPKELSGTDHYGSAELAALGPSLLGNQAVSAVRDRFDAVAV